MSIIDKLFQFRIMRKYPFRNMIIHHEGGEQVSITLRKAAKTNSNVEVGLYSYGCCFNPSFNLGEKLSLVNIVRLQQTFIILVRIIL